jgi:hypothetical protein
MMGTVKKWIFILVGIAVVLLFFKAGCTGCVQGVNNAIVTMKENAAKQDPQLYDKPDSLKKDTPPDELKKYIIPREVVKEEYSREYLSVRTLYATFADRYNGPDVNTDSILDARIEEIMLYYENLNYRY